MKSKKVTVINVKGTEISVLAHNDNDFISLTDIISGFEGGNSLIEQWLRNKDTIEFLAIWEKISNPNFNSLEFEGIGKNVTEKNYFCSTANLISSLVNPAPIIITRLPEARYFS